MQVIKRVKDDEQHIVRGNAGQGATVIVRGQGYAGLLVMAITVGGLREQILLSSHKLQVSPSSS
eukprot:3162933-Rhodomonas_salina.1